MNNATVRFSLLALLNATWKFLTLVMKLKLGRRELLYQEGTYAPLLALGPALVDMQQSKAEDLSRPCSLLEFGLYLVG